jgi:hypothetical protein
MYFPAPGSRSTERKSLKPEMAKLKHDYLGLSDSFHDGNGNWHFSESQWQAVKQIFKGKSNKAMPEVGRPYWSPYQANGAVRISGSSEAGRASGPRRRLSIIAALHVLEWRQLIFPFRMSTCSIAFCLARAVCLGRHYLLQKVTPVSVSCLSPHV